MSLFKVQNTIFLVYFVSSATENKVTQVHKSTIMSQWLLSEMIYGREVN